MKRHGFSLIELMAAVLITSIVVLAAYALITNSAANFKDGDERTILESNMRNAELILQRDLSRTGYHIPFDSKNGNEKQKHRYTTTSTSSDTGIQAFQISNKAFKPAQGATLEANGMTLFSIVGNFTDYDDGFLVKNQNGNVLTIDEDNGTRLPLTAAKVAANDNKRETAHGNEFTSAFQKAFANAIAVRIESPTSDWTIVDITDIDLDEYKVEVESSNPDVALGFTVGSPYLNTKIYPVYAVTYRIIKINNSTTLQRCYSSDITDPLNSITAATCQALINNLEYFYLYPIYHTDAASNTSFAQLSNIVITDYNNADSNIPWPQSDANLTIGNLRGFYFFFGAAGNRQTQLATTIDSNAMQKRFTNNKLPLEHIQGTAIFTTPNRSASTTTL